jgi:hypothetical protein
MNLGPDQENGDSLPALNNVGSYRKLNLRHNCGIRRIAPRRRTVYLANCQTLYVLTTFLHETGWPGYSTLAACCSWLLQYKSGGILRQHAV